MKLYKLLLFIFCFYITQNTYAAERLSSKDYQKLVDLGFNKLDAYADDYSDSEAYWYSLEEHLSFLKKCKVLKMPVIDDSLISVENFAKMTLDHCNETKVKNLKTKDGKAIKVTDEKR